MDYGLYLGCVIPNLFPEVERSVRDIMAKVGADISDLEGASCCAPRGSIGFHRDVWLALNKRNLSLPYGTIVTTCDECYASLYDAELALGASVPHQPEIEPFASFLSKNASRIAPKIERKVDLRCVIQHSCHLLRPSRDRGVDDPESPSIVRKLLQEIGSEAVHHDFELSCCGGLIYEGNDIRGKLARRKVEATRRSGGDCIVTTCAHCLRQLKTASRQIPTLHLAQLFAVALGSDPASIGIPYSLRGRMK